MNGGSERTVEDFTFVEHGLEKQPRGRGGGGVTLARVETLDEGGGVFGAAARLHEGRDELANHLPQEVGRAQTHENQVAGLPDLHEIEDHARFRILGSCVGVGGEIMHAGQAVDCLPHGVDVERIADPPDPRLEERAACTADLVEVDALPGVVSRMEAIGGGDGAGDMDVRWEAVVELAGEAQRILFRADAQMGRLPDGVDSGVRAAGSAEVRIAPGVAGGLEEHPLHGPPRVLLHLPAGVAGSVVFDEKSVGRHGVGLRA